MLLKEAAQRLRVGRKIHIFTPLYGIVTTVPLRCTYAKMAPRLRVDSRPSL